MVGLGPVGVGHRELRHCVVERFAPGQVPIEQLRSDRLAMCPAEDRAGDPRIVVQAMRFQHRRIDRALHVPELPDDECPLVNGGPAKEDVVRGLHPVLSADDPLAVMVVARRRSPVGE